MFGKHFLVLAMAAALCACASWSTPQAESDRAVVRADWVKLKTDAQAAKPAIDAAFAAQPDVAAFIDAVLQKDVVDAIARGSKVYDDAKDVWTKLKAAAPAVAADFEQLRADAKKAWADGTAKP